IDRPIWHPWPCPQWYPQRLGLLWGTSRGQLLDGRKVGAMDEESLFVAALEKATVERQAFLEQACGSDAALRQRLEQLLAAHQRTHGVLERGPDGAGMTAVQREPPLVAERVFAGRFKLRRKLG